MGLEIIVVLWSAQFNIYMRHTFSGTAGVNNQRAKNLWTQLQQDRCPGSCAVVKLITSIICHPLNSSSSSAEYICKLIGLALVQVMACRLFGTKPLPKPMLAYCKFDSWQQTSVTFEAKYKKPFIHENAFKNAVCQMPAIFARGRWLNYLWNGYPGAKIWSSLCLQISQDLMVIINGHNTES